MSPRARNLLAAALVGGSAVWWYIEAGTFRELSRIFPRVVAVVAGLLALLLVVRTLAGHGPTIRLAEGDADERHSRSATLIATVVLWTVLIEPVGLLAASAVGVALMGVVTFGRHRGTVRAILIALAVVGTFYAGFTFLLGVQFP